MRSFTYRRIAGRFQRVRNRAQVFTGCDHVIAPTRFALIQMLERLLSLRWIRMCGGITF
jgi:hypothetical protein